jgi:hypothetical protein
MRQQIERALAIDLTSEVGQDHGNVAAEFPNDLTACTAGRSECIGVGDDGDGVEFMRAFAFGNGFEDGDALGAKSEAVTSVFDIAARKDTAGFRAHRSADAKTRERCVGMFAGSACGGDELLIGRHGVIITQMSGASAECSRDTTRVRSLAFGRDEYSRKKAAR